MTIIINKENSQITRGDDCPSATVILNGECKERVIVVNDGDRGPPGLSNLFFFVRVAEDDLGGHRAVVSNEDGSVNYADNTNLDHLGKVLGVTTSAITAGDEVKIVRGGLINFEGWSWDVDLPVYLATNGLLTQNPASSGFSQIIGFAESPTGLFVNLREPILLT